jgi:2-polyprenyl-3-methyl-5-hydroxy-6-metoxy-1,4-benzoquinol methylase
MEHDPGAAALPPGDACPVCRSRRIRAFITVGDNGHLRRADIRLPVYQCRSCDLFFLNPPPAAEIGREYFADAYAATGKARNIYYDDTFKQRISRLRLDLIGKYECHAGKLLDVGCGKGHFVAAAVEGSWDAWGVELDDGACSYGRDRFGLAHIIAGSMDHPALPADFDVVTMWDVIEHVVDPVGFLRDASQRLRPSGLLLIRTGNIRSWSFDKDRRKWWAFGSDHRFYFSPKSLSVALAVAGFHVVDVLNGETVERPDKQSTRDISQTPVREGIASLARSPVKLAKVGRFGTNLARRLTGPIRYGAHYGTSIMTVVARRLNA